MDRIAARDQSRAHIASGNEKVVSGCIRLTFSEARIERGAESVERSIDRIARSRIQLSEARRALAAR